MIRPITCPNCKKVSAWYDDVQCCLIEIEMPPGIMVFGAYFTCQSCSARFSFNGLKLKKLRQQRKRHE